MRTINAYANSMFRFERLNDAWIDSCAAYLRHVFGDAIEDRTVVDYAFGRGNWSCAFRRAGARRVIAIDAAADNVARFSDQCRENGIDGIDIVHGNVLDEPILAEADIVWLYGILHHVQPADDFMARILALAPNEDAQFYVYAYDKGSLREFVVETARQLTRFESEEEFRHHALCLTRPARMRARDDLMAPYIRWYDARELADLLARHGLRPIARHEGFESFLNHPASQEFAPHQWRARRGTTTVLEMLDPPHLPRADLAALYDMAAAVLALDLDAAEQRRVGLGLFNAHFTALAGSSGHEMAIVEDFLHLYHVLASYGALETATDAAGPYVAIARAALEGHRAANPPRTLLAQRLCRERIRI